MQRLSERSRAKWLEAVGTLPEKAGGNDIVWSAVKAVGVHKRTGLEVANQVEHNGGDFAQYFKTLMQQHVAASTKNVYFTAHTLGTLNEAEMIVETKVPVKGSLKNNGIEAYFSTVVATKRVSIKDLEPYQSDLLNISDEERMLGFKHCFQTKLTKDTIHERIRAPMGMWTTQETFIDNNVQHLTRRLKEYYGN